MKIIIMLSILNLTSLLINGQNLIGYNCKEIKAYMLENRKDMNIENVTNNKFKYLKYSDNTDSQTLLFFLTSDSVCKSVRLICDLRIKQEKVKEFDTLYTKKGEFKWIDNRKGRDYLIELKNEKWSSIVTIEPDK
jgi:hypothetical protein